MPKVPTSIFDVIRSSYFDIFPEVNRRLEEWKEKARAIPNEELRTQALNSIESKTFLVKVVRFTQHLLMKIGSSRFVLLLLIKQSVIIWIICVTEAPRSIPKIFVNFMYLCKKRCNR